MRQRGGITKMFLWWLFIGIAVIAGLLGYFNIIGKIPDKWEVNFPPGYTDYEIKQMPEGEKIEIKKDYFNDLKNYGQKRTCFFEIENNGRILSVKIWTIVDKTIFWTEKNLESPLTDKFDHINPVLEADKLVIWLN